MPRYSRGRRAVKVSRLLRKKIKKVLDSSAEKKWLQGTSHDGPYYGAVEKSWGGTNPTVTGSLQELTNKIFTVAEGSDDQERIGRDIKLNMFRLKGHFYLQESGFPCVTTMLILSMKKTPQLVLSDTAYTPASAWKGPSASLFLGGINGPVVSGPTGNLQDLDSTINSELFTCHYRKVFKIGGQNSTDQIYAPGSGYAITRKFDVNLKNIIGSHIRYEIDPTTPDVFQLNIPKLFLVLLHNFENQDPVYSTDVANAPDHVAAGATFSPPLINYVVFGNFTDV